MRTALAKQAEFSVVTCASGFEALIIVGQLRPDLILMDLAMPRLDGVQTLECLGDPLDVEPHLRLSVDWCQAKA
jgi:Response regulator containing a CheY-like receiver domain and an HTH DNA-binding domain